MKFLFFDTETTGFPEFKMRHSDPAQPHLAQIAARLTDETGETIDAFSNLIDPRGWYLEMPKEAAEAHGLTYQRCLDEGIDLFVALRRFNRLAAQADLCVAHNKNFDMKILRICWTRANMWPKNDPFVNTACTMEMSKPLCKCPPTPKMLASKSAAIRNSFKSPSLQEAYRFFFGEEFDGAHDAGNDTLACAKVFFAARAMSAANAPTNTAVGA